MTVKLALVEDDARYRRNLEEKLGSHPQLQLQASFGSAEDALEQLDRLECNLFLVDLNLPGQCGQNLIATIRSRRPELECIAHTVLEDPRSVFAALQAGAVGYLVKGCTLDELARSLLDWQNGGAPLTPRIARFLVKQFHDNPLTDRERQILSLLAEGHSYQATADLLILSLHTVHTHVKNIYGKLHVQGRQQAIAQARRQGWLE